MQLGVLNEVKVHDLWKHEQYDFSNWLAKPENMELLGDVLGLTLTDVDKEVYVGAYRCDLVARDETTGIKVIIENQLEASDHDHLGKLITYASGLDADVIVWIVAQAREEHRSAIEWLNNNTTDKLSFFLIEVHAYRIGDSLPAPKFETIEKPNGFIKSTKRPLGIGEISKSEAERLEFWTIFNDVLISIGKPFNIGKPNYDSWHNVAMGTSQASIVVNLVNKESAIDLEVYISENKPLFDALFAQHTEIELKLGFAMDWRRLDNKKASRIIYRIPGLNFDDHSNYPQLMNEIVTKVVTMRQVFSKYIKN